MTPLESAHVHSFRATVAQRLGLQFDDSKLNELAKVMRLRLRETRSRDVDGYLRRLGASREELRAVVSHLTVPETYFFRIPEHFVALQEVVLPDRVRARGGSKRLNILSAGCASGEEAYSIAMALMEPEHAELAGWNVAIRGIDVNPEMIAKGRAGHYSAWSLRGITPELKQKFLQPNRREFRVNDRVRGMVSLEEANLADGSAEFWQAGAYDVIFFRNVLMYFSSEAIRTVIDRMANSLAPGGYIFLGPAETMRGVSQVFHLCHTHGTFYYQLRDDAAIYGSVAVPAAPKAYVESASQAVREPAAAGVDDLQDVKADWVTTIRKASERIETLTRNPRPAREPSANRAPDNAAKQTRMPPDVSAALDLLQKERFVEALSALPGGSAETPANTDVQLLRAVLLTNSGNLAEAESACLQLLKTDELNAGAHYVMALCREYSGDQRSAMEHDQIAVYLDSSFAMPHLHLGLLSKRAGDMNTARQELNQASLLLEREDSSRVLLFGGGFSREALVAVCRRELQRCGGPA
jgi:chemotaxis protein methyltransferase CheR